MHNSFIVLRRSPACFPGPKLGPVLLFTKPPEVRWYVSPSRAALRYVALDFLKSAARTGLAGLPIEVAGLGGGVLGLGGGRGGGVAGLCARVDDLVFTGVVLTGLRASSTMSEST